MEKQIGKLKIGESLTVSYKKLHPLSTDEFSFTQEDVNDFEMETIKHAIWRNKVTQQFKDWFKENDLPDPVIKIVKESIIEDKKKLSRKERRRLNRKQNIKNARK